MVAVTAYITVFSVTITESRQRFLVTECNLKPPLTRTYYHSHKVKELLHHNPANKSLLKVNNN